MFDDSDTKSLFPLSDNRSAPQGPPPPRPTFPFGSWVYDPTFGIVHLCGCRICRDYMVHVSEDQEFDATHACALQQRDAELRIRFLEGFRHGRESQKQHDNERLKAYRSQRNEARALNSLYDLQLEEAKQELAELEDELLALRIAYDELRSLSLSNSNRLGYERNTSSRASNPGSSSPPGLAFDASSGSSSESDEELDWEQGLDSDSDEDDAVQTVDGPTARTNAVAQLTEPNETSQVHLSSTGVRATDTSDDETSPVCIQPAPDNGPLEVYVDASGRGIGFIFDGQWEAWKLEAGWHKEGRHIQWAEAVAAELGLRLMIAAGYSRSRILLRSDNQSVVQAVSELDFNEPQIGDIVKNIYSLCREHGITLHIKWIKSRDNPADDPSRMQLGRPDERFPFSINIPTYLRAFVTPLPWRVEE